jgi:hypothetical protein
LWGFFIEPRGGSRQIEAGTGTFVYAADCQAHAGTIKGDPMRKTLIVGATLALIGGSALAQTQTPPAQQGPGNRAINTEGANNSNTPVAGANSFTESQAKSRIEAGGYSNVTELKKDDKGVWRGKAMKDGNTVTVSVDFQGNIIAR